MKQTFVLFGFLLLSVFLSCDKKITSVSTFDAIPYEKLYGKIAFGCYDKIFIIDALNKSYSTIRIKMPSDITSNSISLSPTGEKIVYSSSKPNYETMQYDYRHQLHIKSLDFKNPDPDFQEKITNYKNNYCYMPIWSSNDEILFYLRSSDPISGQHWGYIHRLDQDGSNDSKITKFEVYDKFSLSSNSNLIAFSRQYDISIYNLENNKIKTLISYSDSLSVYSPVFSPDDNYIAYMLRHNQWEANSNPPYYYKIMIINIDGTEITELVNLPIEENITTPYVEWAPRGDKLAYNYGSKISTNSQSRLFIINADGTDLIEIKGDYTDADAPSWIEVN